MCSFQNVSGFIYKNCSIPALLLGREKEGHAAEKCIKVLLGKQYKKSWCEIMWPVSWWNLPLYWHFPDHKVRCASHKNLYLDIKWPYSICHKSPTNSSVSLPYLKNEMVFWDLIANMNIARNYSRWVYQENKNVSFLFMYIIDTFWRNSVSTRITD